MVNLVSIETITQESTGLALCERQFLDNESFIGQVISESDFNLLVSLVRKKVYDIEQITAINELRRLSRKQKPFTI